MGRDRAGNGPAWSSPFSVGLKGCRPGPSLLPTRTVGALQWTNDPISCPQDWTRAAA